MEESIDTYSDEILASLRSNWESFLHSLPKITLALFLFVLVAFVAVRISRFLRYRLKKKAHDQLFATFIAQIIRYALVILGLMLSLQVLGLSGIAGGLLAGAGVSALIIGFAFKDIGENFLSGIILALDRPFNLDDTILISDFMGNSGNAKVIAVHMEALNQCPYYKSDTYVKCGSVMH